MNVSINFSRAVERICSTIGQLSFLILHTGLRPRVADSRMNPMLPLDTSNLPYRRRSMHMVPDKFPSLDYKQLLTDVTESESEVSTINITQISHQNHEDFTTMSNNNKTIIK